MDINSNLESKSMAFSKFKSQLNKQLRNVIGPLVVQLLIYYFKSLNSPYDRKTAVLDNFCTDNYTKGMPQQKDVCSQKKFDRVFIYYADGLPHYIAKTLIESYEASLTKNFIFDRKYKYKSAQQTDEIFDDLFSDIFYNESPKFHTLETHPLMNNSSVSKRIKTNVEIDDIIDNHYKHDPNFKIVSTNYKNLIYDIQKDLAAKIPNRETKMKARNFRALSHKFIEYYYNLEKSTRVDQMKKYYETLDKEKIFNELKKWVTPEKDYYFLYEDVANKIPEVFDPYSKDAVEFYSKLLANIKITFDFINEVQNNKDSDKKMLFILASGHGNYNSYTELQFTDKKFGIENDLNTGFAYFFSKDFADPKQYTPKASQEYTLVDKEIFSTIISNLVHKINSFYDYKNLNRKNEEKIFKELTKVPDDQLYWRQLSLYWFREFNIVEVLRLQEITKNGKKKSNDTVFKLDKYPSPFLQLDSGKSMVDQDPILLKKVLEEYPGYLEKLEGILRSEIQTFGISIYQFPIIIILLLLITFFSFVPIIRETAFHYLKFREKFKLDENGTSKLYAGKLSLSTVLLYNIIIFITGIAITAFIPTLQHMFSEKKEFIMTDIELFLTTALGIFIAMIFYIIFFNQLNYLNVVSKIEHSRFMRAFMAIALSFFFMNIIDKLIRQNGFVYEIQTSYTDTGSSYNFFYLKICLLVLAGLFNIYILANILLVLKNQKHIIYRLSGMFIVKCIIITLLVVINVFYIFRFEMQQNYLHSYLVDKVVMESSARFFISLLSIFVVSLTESREVFNQILFQLMQNLTMFLGNTYFRLLALVFYGVLYVLRNHFQIYGEILSFYSTKQVTSFIMFILGLYIHLSVSSIDQNYSNFVLFKNYSYNAIDSKDNKQSSQYYLPINDNLHDISSNYAFVNFIGWFYKYQWIILFFTSVIVFENFNKSENVIELAQGPYTIYDIAEKPYMDVIGIFTFSLLIFVFIRELIMTFETRHLTDFEYIYQSDFFDRMALKFSIECILLILLIIISNVICNFIRMYLYGKIFVRLDGDGIFKTIGKHNEVAYMTSRNDLDSSVVLKEGNGVLEESHIKSIQNIEVKSD